MKNASAVELGKLGGAARARKLSRKRKKEISMLGGEATRRLYKAKKLAIHSTTQI